MQVCRHCGWENPEIAAFCTNCGTGLGRDKGNGPRFRALGLTPRAEETPADSIDAAWPTVATPSAQTPAATPAARPLGAPLAARTSGDATPAAPTPTGGPIPAVTTPTPTGGPIPAVTTPTPTGGPIPAVTTPTPTAGSGATPAAPAPANGATPARPAVTPARPITPARPTPGVRPVPVPLPTAARPDPARAASPSTQPAVRPVGGVLAQTLVDFSAPGLTGDDDGPRRTEALVSPGPGGLHAPIARRSTGPVLLPDEADISVDQPAGARALLTLGGADSDDDDNPFIEPPPPRAPTPAPAAADPLDDITTERTPDIERPDAPADDPDEPETATPTDPPAPAVDSLEEDGFDEFVDPGERASADDEDDDDDPIVSSIDQPGADDVEIESPDDALAEAIDAFADQDALRLAPHSDAPIEVDDELELSTSDLHADEAPRVLTTQPSIRAVPPPLPPAFTPRYILRPFSQNLGERKIVPLGDAPLTIGREDCDIRVSEDLFVSPRHARFTVQDGTLWIDDLDSLNGVWRRVRTEADLRAGDQILIGQQILRVDAARSRINGVPPPDGTQRLGPPAERSRFRILQIAADGEPLDVYHLPPDGCRLGRRLGDLVFTDDTYMSGTHALLVPGADTVKLHDLSSRNGCWIRITDRARLQIGDAVMIGRTVWRVGRPIA